MNQCLWVSKEYILEQIQIHKVNFQDQLIFYCGMLTPGAGALAQKKKKKKEVK